MKQILQNLRTGRTFVADVPSPLVRDGHVLIRTRVSLISPGTEKMLVDFGKAGWVGKARQHPERVAELLNKLNTDGVKSTLRTVLNKLDRPVPLGYSQVGQVIGVGRGVSGINIGDRVVNNGPHAEIVCVAQNLVARVPDNVEDDEAVFTVTGAVGLQGIRLLHPAMGETVVVAGLGLIGFLTASLLVANGCRVIGLDIDQSRVSLARKYGIAAILSGSDAISSVLELTDGNGADGVMITASSHSEELMVLASRVSRKRGRIVLIGTAGLKINRVEFYKKELSFMVSCSYGAGRYDPEYEEKGRDYPYGLVRWTANRNFQSVLQLMASGMLNVKPLISEIVPIDNAGQVYQLLGKKARPAILISYSEGVGLNSFQETGQKSFKGGRGTIGIIGAGNYTEVTLLPALKGFHVKCVASANGVSAQHLAQKYRMNYSTTDYRNVLADPDVGLVVITTRHDQHAKQVCDALSTGKHVFVEKPITISHEGLLKIRSTIEHGVAGSLTVGFNRRFSPYVRKMKELLGDTRMNVIATMNAGALPPGHWIHDRAVGGGRILGEACHLIDLVVFLADSKITEVCVNYFGEAPKATDDSATIMLKLLNGSTGTIHYFSNGSTAYAKERIEVYARGKTLILDNFERLKGYGFKGFNSMTGKTDKGHTRQFGELIRFVEEGGCPPMKVSELLNVASASLAVYESLSGKKWVEV